MGDRRGPERVGVFIDGFNLYHGVRDATGHASLWLDIHKLCSSLLRPNQVIQQIHYFTAPVRNNNESMARQVTYWQALEAHCPDVQIHRGRFQEKTAECLSCHNAWRTYEEKESDVAIACELLMAAVKGDIDVAFLVSADSDFVPAIKAAKQVNPRLRVVAAMPPRRNSSELKKACNASFQIGKAKIRQAQLPDVVQRKKGTVKRPDYWASKTDEAATPGQLQKLVKRFGR